jgi:hypothetical protein
MEFFENHCHFQHLCGSLLAKTHGNTGFLDFLPNRRRRRRRR